MATDGPRKPGKVFSTLEEGRRLPMAVFTRLAKDVLGRGASFRFQARGNSMTPFIRDGDVIAIVPMRPPTALARASEVRVPALGAGECTDAPPGRSSETGWTLDVRIAGTCGQPGRSLRLCRTEREAVLGPI